jgi:opacity protein-like surface antigen
MRSILTGLGILSVIVGIGPVWAADMPLKAPALVPGPPSWTGFFIGAHVGPGEGKQKFFDNFPTPDGALDADANIRGWVGGYQLGYNYQINWLVLGIL